MRFLPIPAKITQWGLPLVKRFVTSLMGSNDNVDGKKINCYWFLLENNLWTKIHQTAYSA